MVDGDQEREWHQRRCPDGEVPEKVRRVAGWRRAMRDFMQKDPKLNDSLSQFSLKFVKQGQQSRNYVMSTLMDLAWSVLMLTWEGILEGKLPMGEDVEIGFKGRFEGLQGQMAQLRQTWLAEISEHRDRWRQRQLNPHQLQAIAQVSEMDDQEIYRFVPEDALDEQTKVYFKEALQENIKLWLTQAGSQGGEGQVLLQQIDDLKATVKKLEQDLKESQEAREELKDKIAKMQAEHDAADSRPKDDGSSRKLQEAAEALAQAQKEAEEALAQAQEESARMKRAHQKELEGKEVRISAYTEMMQALDVDPSPLTEEELKSPASFMKLVQRVLDKRTEAENAMKAALAAAQAEAKAAKEALAAAGAGKAVEAPKPEGGRKQELQAQLAEEKKLEQELKKLQQELEERRQKQQQEQKELDRQRSELEELQKRLQQLRDELEQQEKQLEKQRLEQEREREALEQQRKLPEQQRRELDKKPTSRPASGKPDAGISPEELRRANAEIDRLNQQVAAIREEKDELERKWRAAEGEAESLRAQVRALQLEVEAAQAALKKPGAPPPPPPPKMQDNSGALAALEAQHRAQISDLEAEAANLLKQLAKSRENEDMYKAEIEGLRAQLEQIQALKAALEASLEALRLKFEELKALLAAQGVDISAFDNIMEELEIAAALAGPLKVFERLYLDAMQRLLRKRQREAKRAENLESEWVRKLGGSGALLRNIFRNLIAGDGSVVLEGETAGAGGSPCQHCGHVCQHCGHHKDRGPVHQPPALLNLDATNIPERETHILQVPRPRSRALPSDSSQADLDLASRSRSPRELPRAQAHAEFMVVDQQPGMLMALAVVRYEESGGRAQPPVAIVSGVGAVPSTEPARERRRTPSRAASLEPARAASLERERSPMRAASPEGPLAIAPLHPHEATTSLSEAEARLAALAGAGPAAAPEPSARRAPGTARTSDRPRSRNGGATSARPGSSSGRKIVPATEAPLPLQRRQGGGDGAAHAGLPLAGRNADDLPLRCKALFPEEAREASLALLAPSPSLPELVPWHGRLAPLQAAAKSAGAPQPVLGARCQMASAPDLGQPGAAAPAAPGTQHGRGKGGFHVVSQPQLPAGEWLVQGSPAPVRQQSKSTWLPAAAAPAEGAG